MSTHQFSFRGVDQPLPIYAGYAIGNPIHKALTHSPVLFEQQGKIQGKIRELEETIEENRGNQRDTNILSDAERISRIAVASTQKQEALVRLDAIKKQIEAIPNFEIGDGVEMLPIDGSETQIRVLKRSFSSENFRHTIITQAKLDESNLTIQKYVQKFLRDLTLDEMNIPPDIQQESVNKISRGVEGFLQSSSEVSLIGSFVSLPRSRVMDPICVRKNAVSDSMKQNAHKYSVITEAILGATFIGYGLKTKEQSDVRKESEKINETTQITQFNFHAQGTIPKTSVRFDQVNLWDVYNSWKEQLFSDPESGYPIAIKVRELTEILRENKIDLDLHLKKVTQ